MSDGGVTTNSTDTATFNGSFNVTQTVTVDENRNIRGISFSGNSTAYVLNGGSLLLSGGGTISTGGGGAAHTDTITTPLKLHGSYTISANSSTVGRILNITGNITGNAPASTSQTLNLSGSNGGNNVLSGVISDGAGGSVVKVTKSGTGAWTLSGNNTFTGGFTINAGTLKFTSAGALGLGGGPVVLGSSDSESVSLLNTNSSADVNFVRNMVVQSPRPSKVTIGSEASGSRSHTFSGNIRLGTNNLETYDVTLTSGHGSGLTTFSGVIYSAEPSPLSAGLITIVGGDSSTLSLAGNNTFHRGVLLSSGRLSLNHGSALGSGPLTIDGGDLYQVKTTFTSTQHNPQVWNSDFRSSGSYTVDMGTGRVDLGATGTATTRVITSENTGTTGAKGLAVRGPISDGTNGTTVNLTKAGEGILSLGGASDYSGDTSVLGGTLRLVDGDNRLPVATNLFIQGGEYYRGTFDLNGWNQTISGLSGGSGDADGIVTNTGAGTSTLNVTGTSKFEGLIIDGSPTGKTALMKSGEGTFTLENSFDIHYSGATTVTGGTLALLARLSLTSAIRVGNGGILEIGAPERIKDNAPFALEGGTFRTNGFSESLGKLTLSGTSTIDLGAGASTLIFEPSSTMVWDGSLSILNWSGSLSGDGVDQVSFLSHGYEVLTSSQIARVSFVDPIGFEGIFPARLTMQNELVPVIPEPSSTSMVMMGIAGVLSFLRIGRKRFRV